MALKFDIFVFMFEFRRLPLPFVAMSEQPESPAAQATTASEIESLLIVSPDEIDFGGREALCLSLFEEDTLKQCASWPPFPVVGI